MVGDAYGDGDWLADGRLAGVVLGQSFGTQHVEFGELFAGGPLFFSVLGASILAGLALFLGALACVVPAILLMLFFWPFYWPHSLRPFLVSSWVCRP